MRLLNCYTGCLEEFFGTNMPKYAILSHTWEKEELTFDDVPKQSKPIDPLRSMTEDDWARTFSSSHAKNVQRKAGYFKVVMSCWQAFSEDKLSYVWIDTCCIDKTSSSELTESINSMFQWYSSATVCYAYLQDVHHLETEDRFQRSRWFTRGWTLQELLAPEVVQFYGKEWTLLGDKVSLISNLQTATGIDETTILDPSHIPHVCVARRMAWASKRRTTRIEDIAYSLLGLFSVNMPLLYGEGRGAFVRLQEEILKISDDQTILAWGIANRHFNRAEVDKTLTGSEICYLTTTSVLASSPLDFVNSHSVSNLISAGQRHPSTMTHKGLSIQMPFVTKRTIQDKTFSSEYVIGVIACRLMDSPWNECLGILLKQFVGSSVYRRVAILNDISCISCDSHDISEVETIFISQPELGWRSRLMWSLDYRSLVDSGYRLMALFNPHCEGYMQVSRSTQVLTYYSLSESETQSVLILIFYNENADEGFGFRCRANSLCSAPRLEISDKAKKPKIQNMRNWLAKLDPSFRDVPTSEISSKVQNNYLFKQWKNFLEARRNLPKPEFEITATKEQLLGLPVFVVSLATVTSS